MKGAKMELNAEQIKKALECCTRGRKSKEDRPCLDCPYNECNIVGGTSERQVKGTCQGWLMKDALSLIKSQEQRIKELTEEKERLRLDVEVLGAELSRYTENIVQMAKQDNADTVRKMQEKAEAFLTDEETDVIIAEGEVFIPISAIRKIAKEMLEGLK
jgi:hypothetical protein